MVHCEKFRHCNPSCEYGNNCIRFHDKQHIETYKHPFQQPCPLTPYHCTLDEQFTMTNNIDNISYEVDQHCLDFAHVCRFGRNCTDKDSLHWEKWIHVLRPICPFSNQCTKLVQEDHLNSFTHPNIRDIRFLCKYADKCRDRRNPKHLSKYRHIITFEDSGIVRYYNLNQNIDFIQNQKDNIERITKYIRKEKWETLKSESNLHEIIDWIRTVQPVHRCRPEIFESILLHGHVMSRDYMENLKKSKCVIDSILQHSRLRRIKYLKEKKCAKNIKSYVTALVLDEFEKQSSKNQSSDETITKVASSPSSFSDFINMESHKELIKNKEVILSYILSEDDIKTIKTTAISITQASIKLRSKPTGIGYERDKDLGTNKNVFSILGPHMGDYGDVFIVFKREILHHPDANFSIQSATSYASGRAFKWRPWLGNDPGSQNDRINLFHKTKLHASITGYEYATALELIATISQDLKKKSMNIDLETILNCWLARDSHKNIEGHLPQLIPLDYIEHIYMPQNIFDLFNNETCKAIKTIFDDRISIKSFQSLEIYRKFVIKDLIDKYGQRNIHSISRPIQGTVITIPSTDFNDPFVLPLTISQAYEQYKIDHLQTSTDMTVYIYWQVMNGDMMLTLSNEQINTGEQQPNLRCLICYIAEKPSTKDIHYYEHVSYLYNGQPFQHEIVIKEQRYVAKSRSFYIGCNTDDFMTFCLEIERSTGKVILSHSGPNSIYNHEKISSIFSKSNLDLNQLNYIHVSAGTHTVPIRNLFITFEKQPELLDSINSNVQLNLPDLRHANHIDNNKTVLSRIEIVKQSNQNPATEEEDRLFNEFQNILRNLLVEYEISLDELNFVEVASLLYNQKIEALEQIKELLVENDYISFHQKFINHPDINNIRKIQTSITEKVHEDDLLAQFKNELNLLWEKYNVDDELDFNSTAQKLFDEDMKFLEIVQDYLLEDDFLHFKDDILKNERFQRIWQVKKLSKSNSIDHNYNDFKNEMIKLFEIERFPLDKVNVESLVNKLYENKDSNIADFFKNILNPKKIKQFIRKIQTNEKLKTIWSSNMLIFIKLKTILEKYIDFTHDNNNDINIIISELYVNSTKGMNLIEEKCTSENFTKMKSDMHNDLEIRSKIFHEKIIINPENVNIIIESTLSSPVELKSINDTTITPKDFSPDPLKRLD